MANLISLARHLSIQVICKGLGAELKPLGLSKLVYRSSNSRTQGGPGDSEVPSDQALSDILDEVIENMPDTDRPAPEVNVLMDMESSRQLRSDYAVSVSDSTEMVKRMTRYTVDIHNKQDNKNKLL